LPREVLDQKPVTDPARKRNRSLGTIAPAPATAAIDKVAAAIAGAEFPVILTSTLGRDPHNVSLLAQLADTWGIAVIQASARDINIPSNHPMNLGYELKPLLQSADVILAGGTEEISCILATAAFDGLHALSVRNETPERASRPFDRSRDGFVIGEGAGILVLEEFQHAVRRGARIDAEIAGVGMASEAHHLTAPDPRAEGATLAMQRALDDAGCAATDVRYVNAHGTSTPLNDAMETRALHRVLGAHARAVAVSSTKSMIGHLLGASAAVGLVATVLTVREGVIHPTINYEEPDPDCDLDYVPNESRRMDVGLALANAFAFGGHCVSLAVRAVR